MSRDESFVLCVRVIEACDLMEKRLLLGTDPYCHLQLGGVRFQTKRVKATLNPVFVDETFVFRIEASVQPLGAVLLAIFDCQAIGDDVFLGEARLHLRHLSLGLPLDEWLPLHSRNPRDPVSGELRVMAELWPHVPDATVAPTWWTELDDTVPQGLPPPYFAFAARQGEELAGSSEPSITRFLASATATFAGNMGSEPEGQTGHAPTRSINAPSRAMHTHDGIIRESDLVLQPATGAPGAAAHALSDGSAIFSVLVVGATNLTPDERRRPIAPYVKLRVGSQDPARTRTISDVDGIAKQERGDGAMTDPVWVERFEFRVASLQQDVLFEVKSRYILRTKLLASHSSSVVMLTPAPNVTFDLVLPLETAADIRHMAVAAPPMLRVLLTRHEAVHEVDAMPFDHLGVTVSSYADGLKKLVGDSQVGFLRVTLLRAGQHLTTLSGAVPNVFVQLELGHTLHRSQTKWQNANPIWGGEIFDFCLTDLSECLDLVVLHENGEYMADSTVIEPEFIGARRIAMQEAFSLHKRSVWLPLKVSVVTLSGH